MKKAVLTLMAGAAILTGCTSTMNHEWHRDCTVLDKDMLYDQSSHDKHGGSSSTSRTKRLSTSCGVYDVSDSIGGGFNSYDRWAQLQIGKKYDIQTGGYRNGFFNSFPTIIAIDGPK